MPWDDEEARQHVEQAETLLSALDAETSPAAAQVMRAVHELVGVYGDGLARIMRRIDQAGHHELGEELGSDELVSHLLLIHDLHPVDTATRARRAVDELRPSLAEHGVELPSTEVTGLTVLVHAEVRGCPSTVETVRTMVRDAVAKVAPEIEHVDVDTATPRTTNVIPVESLFTGGHVAGTG